MSDLPSARRTHSGRELTPDQRFWQLWRSGRRPDLATFLAGLSGPSPAEAAAVIAIDQYERWLAGDRASAETYLALLPPGEGREQAECDIVYGEYLLREQLGEKPTLEEYRARFSTLADALQRQLDLHHALAESSPAATVLSETHPFDMAPPLSIPGYEILGEIGRGGMGIVYKARQLSLNRVVALKVLQVRPGRDDAMLDRMRREAHLTARMSHPNIVAIHDAGASGEWFYLAMEYVPGIDLHRLVERDGPLPPERAIEYMRQAARGLQHAHELGLVHRDIKPSNLIVTEPAGAGRGGSVLKLLDLGLARSAPLGVPGEPITQHGAFMGTPDFIAPEQANDPRAADVRSDLYSLGCTFYYALTGRAPFSGATPLAKLMQHHLNDAPPLGELPGGLSSVISKLMAKQPADRYQTPAELLASLDARRAAPPTPSVRVTLERRLTGPTDWVKCVAFSPDGKTLAAAGVDRMLRFWEVSSGAELWRGEAHTPAVLCLAFSPDGCRLVTGGQDRAVCLWELDDPVRPRLRWRAIGHTDNVNAVCYLPGERLLSASHDGSLRLWDGEGRELAHWPGHIGPVWGVSASADGRLAISGGQDRTVRVWDLVSGAVVATWAEQSAVISCVSLSGDGKRAVTGGGDGTSRIWEVPSGRELAILTGHVSRVTATAFSPDGTLVATGSRDRTARLFSLSGTALATLAEHSWWVTSVAWSPARDRLATGSGDRSVGLWRLS